MSCRDSLLMMGQCAKIERMSIAECQFRMPQTDSSFRLINGSCLRVTATTFPLSSSTARNLTNCKRRRRRDEGQQEKSREKIANFMLTSETIESSSVFIACGPAMTSSRRRQPSVSASEISCNEREVRLGLREINQVNWANVAPLFWALGNLYGR